MLQGPFVKHFEKHKRKFGEILKATKCWYLYSHIQGYKFQFFGDFSKSLRKSWETLREPFVTQLRKIKEFMRKPEIYQNVDKCTLRFESRTFNFFYVDFTKSLQKSWKIIWRPFVTHLRKIKTFWENLKVAKVLIFI